MVFKSVPPTAKNKSWLWLTSFEKFWKGIRETNRRSFEQFLDIWVKNQKTFIIVQNTRCSGEETFVETFSNVNLFFWNYAGLLTELWCHFCACLIKVQDKSVVVIHFDDFMADITS